LHDDLACTTFCGASLIKENDGCGFDARQSVLHFETKTTPGDTSKQVATCNALRARWPFGVA
jgi:hypothetical protein